MVDTCPRCSGVLNQQWDVFLRQWESHCITCGNLPGVNNRKARMTARWIREKKMGEPHVKMGSVKI